MAQAQPETATKEETQGQVNDTVETKATDGTNTNTGAATTGTENKEEEKKDSIYSQPMLPRIEVGNGYRAHRPLNFYVDRARRILRTEKTLEVTGHGLSYVFFFSICFVLLLLLFCWFTKL